MADREHLRRLQMGVEHWNKWWINNLPMAIDLSDADLSRMKLSGTVLMQANLKNSNLSGAFLEEARLNGASLSSSIIRSARLLRSDLFHADLSKADLSKSCLFRANLGCANLTEASLYQADFSEAEFHEANLCKADMREGNFEGTDLRRANLSGADLRGANLNMAKMLGANLAQANLTGACLQNWSINHETNLEGIQAKYIYLERSLTIQGESEFLKRRPHSGNFKPGKFAALFQQALDTLDLIFVDGIDWQAFFASFQELRQQYNDADLTIQAIEKKSGGSFVVRLEVAEEADKAAIEQSAKANYQQQLQLLEARYQAQLQAKDEVIDSYKKHSAEMSAIAQALANTPRTQFSQYNYGDSTGFQNDIDNSTANQGKAIDISQNPPTAPESSQ